MKYNKWPDDPALANANAVPIKVRGPILKSLLGDNSWKLNTLDLPEATPAQRWGLVMVLGEAEFHDLWGTCFFLMVDINAENRISNPEQVAGAITPPRLSSKAPKLIPASTLVFSAGPDRDPNTWADNITSWR